MKESEQRRFVGALQVIASGVGFGFLGIFGKLAFHAGLSIGELLTFRFSLAAILLFTFLGTTSPKRLRISRDQLLVCAGLGILGYAVFASLYFKAIEGVTVALASLLLYTYPVVVALGARILFKERLSLMQWIALPMTAIGLLILLKGDTEVRSFLAIAAGLGSAACYSFYILASSRLQKTIDPVTSGVYVILFAAIGLGLLHRPDPNRLLSLNLNDMLIILGIAVVSTVGPMILFLSGLQKLGNTEASLLSTVEPVTAVLAGALIFGETLSTAQLVGGAVILASLAATTFARPSTRDASIE